MNNETINKFKKSLRILSLACILLISLLFGIVSITCFIASAPYMGVFYLLFSITMSVLLFKKSKTTKCLVIAFIIMTCIMGIVSEKIAPEEPEILEHYLESHQI